MTTNLAPFPYTPEAIRDSFVEGLEVDWEIQGQPMRWRVVAHDAAGLALHTAEPGKAPTTTRSTWSELQSHASFPASETAIVPAELQTPFGTKQTRMYSIGDKRFWFGDDTPGAPLRHTSPGFEMKMVRREVQPLPSRVLEVDADGVQLWTRSEGSGGPPLVMVHGGPGMTAFPFEHGVGPMLAASRQVVYTDYRGAGRSSRPEGTQNYSFRILADDVARIRDAHELEKIVLLGHSNGAATALTHARDHADRVAALILVCPLLSPVDLEANLVNKAIAHTAEERAAALAILNGGGPLEQRFFDMLNALPSEGRHAMQFASPEGQARFDGIMERFKDETGLESTMTPDLILGMREAGFFAFDGFSFVDDLSMPVLLIVGSDDPEISTENTKRFALAVGGTYVEIPGAGHHPFVEQPEAMATAIDAFLFGTLE